MFVNFNILNQLGSPAINSNTFANRPAAGQTGRLFVSTDTFEIYRDNGTTWDLIGGPGSSTITGTGQATEVAFFTSSQAISSSANLFWDNTNTRLGVGTATPGYTIEANGAVKGDRLYITGMVAGNGVIYHNPTINAVTIANYNSGGIVRFETNAGIPQMNIDTAGALSLGNGNTAADTSSILDIGSTTRGFLQPRMTTAQRNLIATPATGLSVYNTTSNTIDYYNGTSWISLSTTTGTVTGTGTATQVAFWSASSTISGSNNLYWDNVTGSLGVNTNTPSAELDVHGTGVIAQLNSTSATANSLLAFQRSGSGVWRIGDTYNGGNNFFELHNTVLTSNAIEVVAASNEATFVSSKTYSSGNAIGVAVRHNLTIPNGTNVGLAALGGVNSNLNLSLGGNTTVAATGRQGLEGSTSISFTGAGTLTMTQGSTVRAFSSLSSVYAFNGSAVGTITHLAGLRICFPDNVGSAVNITNNYALLINNQTTGTGTVTYTNRWGIYQEGASDLNYLAANLLIGSTTNSGEALQVTGTAKITSTLTANSLVKSGGTASQILAADGSVITAGTNITIAAGTISASGGITGSGAAGQVTYWSSASAVTGNNNLFWDNTNARLGINTTTPGFQLELFQASSDPYFNFYRTTNGTGIGLGRLSWDGYRGTNTRTNYGFIQVQTQNTGATTYAGQMVFLLATGGSINQVGFVNENGNWGLGTNTIGSRLQVNGGAAIGYSASTAAPTNGLIVAGQSTFSDNITITKNQNATTETVISNTTSNTLATAQLTITSSNGSTNLGKRSALYGTYKIIVGNDTYLYNGTAGDISILNDVGTGTIKFAAGGSSSANLTITSAGDLSIADAKNIILATTTGTKIGTATSQKLAFWNATPIVQPTTAVAGAARVGGGGATVTDTDTFGGYTIAQVVQALRNTGILA